MRTHYGIGYSPTASAEAHYTAGTVGGFTGRGVPVIYAHGHGIAVSTLWSNTTYRKGIFDFAKTGIVTAPHLGGSVWGNDTHVDRIEDAVAFLEAKGHKGPYGFVSFSMGFAGIAHYARLNPTKVKFLIGALALTDMAKVYARVAADAQASIDAAYGGAYNDNTHGPNYSPVQYAHKIPARIPVLLVSDRTDTIVLTSDHEEFKEARPKTSIDTVTNFGHTESGVQATLAKGYDWATRNGLLVPRR